MSNAPSAPVAVIDIGSNSIKALVARRGAFVEVTERGRAFLARRH